MKKLLTTLMASALLLSSLAACQPADPGEESGAETDMTPTAGNDITDEVTEPETKEIASIEPKIIPITYEHILPAEDLERFIAEVDYLPDDPDPKGVHDNSSKEVGVIDSPYFTMSVNGVPVECYATRSAKGAHSFAIMDVTDTTFPLEVTVTVEPTLSKVTILPEHYGVVPTADGQTVTATIEDYGNYTLVVNNKKELALTIFVREDKEYVAPEGYEIVKIAPGVHNEKLVFTDQKQVMYFEAGVHYLKYKVDFLSNTEVYFEPGTYIYATMPDFEEDPLRPEPNDEGNYTWDALFKGDEVENVRITGHGFVEMSNLEMHARGFIQFNLSTNVTLDGFTGNNCPDWTIYMSRCNEVNINEVALFGYRQNSDAICIEDSRNVLVQNCFARSGDDHFEIKSRYGHYTEPIENIVFDNCNAWPDKARGIGIINEVRRDMTNITFKNCSVGFATASWMDDLGALVVFSEHNEAKVTNVTFENIEVHHADQYAVLIVLGEDCAAQFENIVFRNVTFKDSAPVRINNRSTVGGTIKNVVFENCYRKQRQINKKSLLIPRFTNVDESEITYVVTD